MQKLWFPFVVIVLMLLAGYALAYGQTKYAPIKKSRDIKFGLRTILVVDENNSTVTLVPGDQGQDLWICAPHEHGKSCKEMGAVVQWLLENGSEGQ